MNPLFACPPRGQLLKRIVRAFGPLVRLDNKCPCKGRPARPDTPVHSGDGLASPIVKVLVRPEWCWVQYGTHSSNFHWGVLSTIVPRHKDIVHIWLGKFAALLYVQGHCRPRQHSQLLHQHRGLVGLVGPERVVICQVQRVFDLGISNDEWKVQAVMKYTAT